MHSIRRLFILSSGIIIGLAACKKDSDKPSESKRDILLSGSWTLSSSVATYDLLGVPQTTDLLTLLESCEKDNRYIFNTNGTITDDEGSTKCNETDPQQSQEGAWSLINNETQMQITDPTGTLGTITADIIQLDETTLKVQYVDEYNGVTATSVTAYSHNK